MNATASRLAAPTTNGVIRIYDLITEGSRDYIIDTTNEVGRIERMAWSLDDRALYFVTRELPALPLELRQDILYPADTTAAELVIWELDLVNGHTTRLESLGDGYGISSMTVTDEFVYAVLVETNEQLVTDLNSGVVPSDIASDDPLLDSYIPRTVLWRIGIQDGSLFAVGENIWGIVARPY